MSRERRDLLVLFLLSLVVRLATAAFISRAGYMDPAYYAAGAVNLAEGGGLDEPYIWNYLGEPEEIPQPGFLYWMPLPSLLAAPFAASFPGSFFALQIPFALLSALLPLVGYGVARRAVGSRRSAWAAGLITLFSGFFFPHWTLPETFAPFALFGSLALWLAGGNGWVSLLVGLLVGLAHLTRADGVMLLPVVALAPLFLQKPSITDHSSRITSHVLRLTLHHSLFVVLGYLFAMGPWFIRNSVAVGSPLAPGGAKTLWLTHYDDLYCYGCDLSLQSYLAWGWGNILQAKLSALSVNLQRFLGENCLVFLLPLAVIGFYRLRRKPSFPLSLIYLVLVYLAHSLAFTYPGVRGGFFHASSAVLPFLFAAAMDGLEATVKWVGQRRRWKIRQATAVFTVAVVAGAVVFGLYAGRAKVRAWQGVDRAYERVGDWMEQARIGEEAVVMANNAPAFWYYTRHPAVAVPAHTGGVEALLAAADRYGVTYVVLDRNWPLPPDGLVHPRLQRVAEWGEGALQVVLYEVIVR
ncbi:MAG: hypothetical protein JW918_10130 [Anaerolineae bacterium]|nr:hypothetical protein [Anaerolineae bacterium]